MEGPCPPPDTLFQRIHEEDDTLNPMLTNVFSLRLYYKPVLGLLPTNIGHNVLEIPYQLCRGRPEGVALTR